MSAPRLPARVPGSFLTWLAASGVSNVGAAGMYFALGWAATAHGGLVAGLVVGTVTASRTALLLLGGAVADRIGSRVVLIAGDAALLVVTAAVGLTAWALGTSVWLLVLAALAEGVVTAFYYPAAGSMPRWLVEDAAVPRAVALRQAVGQAADLIGGPLGGVLVAAAGFAAAAGVDAVTFLPVLIVTVLFRTNTFRPTATTVPKRSVWHEAADGVTVSLSRPVLRFALLLTAVAAGAVIPTGSLLVPLLVRGHHWSAVAAGAILGGQSAGGMVVAGLIARTGAFARPGLAGLGGLAVVTAGLLTLAAADTPVVAAAAGVAIGAGVALFVSHSGPLVLIYSPDTHLSRVQAMLGLVQAITLVVASPLLGVTADHIGPRPTLATVGLVLAAATVAGTLNRSWRTSAFTPTLTPRCST